MFGSIKTLTSGDFGNMRADCTVQWRTSTVTRELNFTPTQHSPPHNTTLTALSCPNPRDGNGIVSCCELVCGLVDH